MCTIDMHIPELEYIANHLTSQECRLLVASLHFSELLQKVSEDVPCITMLIKWNNVKDDDTTHEVVAYELRRMGKRELADWLGATVFHKLAKDLDKALTGPFFVTSNNFEDINFALFKDNDVKEEEFEWNMIDVILYILIVGLFGAILFTCWRTIVLSFTKAKELITEEEEMSNLLSHAVDDEQDICEEESQSMSALVK